MKSRFLASFLHSIALAALLAAVSLIPIPMAGQTATAKTQAAPKSAKTWTPPKTPWGDPDLQGVWPGTDMIGTPLERDRSLGTRAFLTDEEFAKKIDANIFPGIQGGPLMHVIAGKAVVASRPPANRDKCLRTVLTSSMAAPLRSNN